MSGNKEGGKKTAKVVKEQYGEDFYKRIGAIGGKKGTTGGFFANRDLAKSAGSIGGKKRWAKWREQQEKENTNDNA